MLGPLHLRPKDDALTLCHQCLQPPPPLNAREMVLSMFSGCVGFLMLRLKYIYIYIKNEHPVYIAKCRICIGFVPAIKVGMRSHDMMACPTWRLTFKGVHVTPGLHVRAGNPTIDSNKFQHVSKIKFLQKTIHLQKSNPKESGDITHIIYTCRPGTFVRRKWTKNTFPCHVRLFCRFTSICSRFWPILQSFLGECVLGNKSSSQFDEYIFTDSIRYECTKALL